VRRKQDGAAVPMRQVPQDSHDFNPAWKVEEGGNFVKNQELRLLGKGSREHDPLGLAVARLGDVSRCQGYLDFMR